MAGLVYVAHDDRLHERFVEGFAFSTVWASQPKLSVQQMALLSADQTAFEAVALATRGRKAATYTWHLAMDPVLPFDADVPLEEFLPRLPKATSEALRRALEVGGAELSSDDFEHLLSSIVEVRPDAAAQVAHIRGLLAKVPLNPPRSDESEPIVLYEGDAVALSLQIAGFDRSKELQSWIGTASAPFLEGIAEYRVSEEMLIDHDARHFGDWEIIADNLVGGVQFADSSGRLLTVMNVNHEPVEETLGVDLIYYNHDYDCYVLVQYKRMQSIENDAEFRPNRQLENELLRMRAIAIEGRDAEDARAYRLDHHCCFLKLCWPTTKQFYAGDIVPGMYFPLVYWDLLLASEVARGPRDGVRVLGNTAGRRLNRTSFVGLVQDAWVGSRCVTTEQIEAAIRSGIDAGHSVVLAAGRRQS